MDRHSRLVAPCFAHNEGLTPFSHLGRADLLLIQSESKANLKDGHQ
jgi:hypothetical protein